MKIKLIAYVILLISLFDLFSCIHCSDLGNNMPISNSRLGINDEEIESSSAQSGLPLATSLEEPEETIKSSITLQQHQFVRTIDMVQGLSKVFSTLFNPAQVLQNKEENPEETETNTESLQNALQLLTSHLDPTSLLAQASTYLSPSSSAHPELKSSEYNTLVEIMVRTGMINRPQYFSQTDTSADNSSDLPYETFSKFLQEFTQGNALNTWLSFFKNEIDKKETNKELGL